MSDGERPNPASVVEALQGTKEVLQRQGRTRLRNFRDGKVCLNGATLVATGANRSDGTYYPDNSQRWSLYSRTGNALDKTARTLHGTDSTTFNDAVDTTDEQVYELIDAAIAGQTTTD